MKKRKKKLKPIDVRTPKCRFAFTDVFEPRSHKGKKPMYGAVMLFKKSEDISALKKAAMQQVVRDFGEEYADRKNWPEGFKWPFRNGDKKKGDYEGFKGCIYVSANSKFPVGVVANTSPPEPITEESGEFYAGCYGRALLRPGTFSVDGNEGVKFYLEGIQKLADGPRFGGGPKDLAEEFDYVEDEDTSEDDDSDDDTDEDDDY
jgi:hypothetical protein